MNVLIISSLSSSPSTGPAWSVPARVDALSKICNVLWVNASTADQEHWRNVSSYHNIKEYRKLSLSALPKPFNKPDIVVFEGFYSGMSELIISIQCRLLNIPYVIVPRCSLTKEARNNNSWLKKKIAHFIFYDSFISHAASIQYLTHKEYEDSKDCPNNVHFILPNGAQIPDETKLSFSKKSIKAIFIGRIDIYHKGIDLLIEACRLRADQLRSNGFALTIYGPKFKDYCQTKELIAKANLSDIIKLGGEVLGERKKRAILDADLFILTSRFEGHPMGLIEALSYGLPCLITSGTNIATEVFNAKCGFVSDTSVEGIVSSLDSLLEHKHELKLMSESALSLSRIYDWDSIARAFKDHLQSLI